MAKNPSCEICGSNPSKTPIVVKKVILRKEKRSKSFYICNCCSGQLDDQGMIERVWPD